MVEFLEFAALGRIVLFVLQRFPFRKFPRVGKWFKEGRFFGDLFGCDLCLGVWVYSILAISFQYDMLTLHLPFLSWVLTGVATSFLVHVFAAGWQALYNVTVIGGE